MCYFVAPFLFAPLVKRYCKFPETLSISTNQKMFLLTFIYHHTSDTHPHLPLHSHLHRVIRKKPRYQFHIICLLCKHGNIICLIFSVIFLCTVEQKSTCLRCLEGVKEKVSNSTFKVGFFNDTHYIHPFSFLILGYSKSFLECFTDAHCDILYSLRVTFNRTLFRFLFIFF